MALLIAVARVRVCIRRSVCLKFEYCVKGDAEMPQILDAPIHGCFYLSSFPSFHVSSKFYYRATLINNMVFIVLKIFQSHRHAPMALPDIFFCINVKKYIHAQ
jgi:hypothetical protein